VSPRGVAWWQMAWDLHSRSRVRVRTCTSCKSLGQPGFYLLTWAIKYAFRRWSFLELKKKSIILEITHSNKPQTSNGRKQWNSYWDCLDWLIAIVRIYQDLSSSPVLFCSLLNCWSTTARFSLYVITDTSKNSFDMYFLDLLKIFSRTKWL